MSGSWRWYGAWMTSINTGGLQLHDSEWRLCRGLAEIHAAHRWSAAVLAQRLWAKPCWNSRREKNYAKKPLCPVFFGGSRRLFDCANSKGGHIIKGSQQISKTKWDQTWTGVSSSSGRRATGWSEGQQQVSAPSLPFCPIFFLLVCTLVWPPVPRSASIYIHEDLWKLWE